MQAEYKRCVDRINQVEEENKSYEKLLAEREYKLTRIIEGYNRQLSGLKEENAKLYTEITALSYGLEEFKSIF